MYKSKIVYDRLGITVVKIVVKKIKSRFYVYLDGKLRGNILQGMLEH